VIFLDEPATEISTIKVDWLQRTSLTVLAIAVLFLGIMPAALLAPIVASVH
jgi:NADH:ubiquinone oxidoreductase subunit 4 (subunit M)